MAIANKWLMRLQGLSGTFKRHQNSNLKGIGFFEKRTIESLVNVTLKSCNFYFDVAHSASWHNNSYKTGSISAVIHLQVLHCMQCHVYIVRFFGLSQTKDDYCETIVMISFIIDPKRWSYVIL